MYDHEKIFFEGTSLMGDQKFKEALPKFNAVLKTHPKYHAARSNKGLCLAAMKKFDSALDCFDYIINDDPNFGMAYAHKASVLVTLGRFKESDEAFLKLMDIDPDHPCVLENEGKRLLANHDEEGALEMFKALVEKAPEYADSVEGIINDYIKEIKTGKKIMITTEELAKKASKNMFGNKGKAIPGKPKKRLDSKKQVNTQTSSCGKCFPAKAQKFSPRKTWVSKCSKCGGMVITLSSDGMWYVGNAMALADYFETNRMATMISVLFSKLTMFGLARSSPDSSYDIFSSIVKDEKQKLDTEMVEMVGSVARMTVLAGTMGKGYAVCCDFDVGRLVVCDPGEKFGTTLYESAGKNASPNEVGNACTQFKIGMGA